MLERLVSVDTMWDVACDDAHFRLVAKVLVVAVSQLRKIHELSTRRTILMHRGFADGGLLEA